MKELSKMVRKISGAFSLEDEDRTERPIELDDKLFITSLE